MEEQNLNSILYLDDEQINLDGFYYTFRKSLNVKTCLLPSQAFECLEQQEIKVVITDFRMPEMNGLEFIKRASAKYPDIIYMVLTAYPDLEIILEAFNKYHIYQFIIKPWKENELKIIIANAIETYDLKKKNMQLVKELTEANKKLDEWSKQLENENIILKTTLNQDNRFNRIVTQNEAFRKILKEISVIADSSASVLIQGETGTGKELIAKTIHELSPRKSKPMVTVNCAAIPENLMESELFGHEKGAFTGAISLRIGKFEMADKGTLFLDEIGELPINLQPKILRAIQEGEIERIGSSKTIKVDVRIIAATNRDLKKEVEKKNFREDLFYRLFVCPVYLPPLRERKEDIPLLVRHFIDKYSKKHSRPTMSITQSDLNLLKNYIWPGNIRELENVIERAVIISTGKILKISDVFISKSVSEEFSVGQNLNEVEKNHILQVLRSTNWRIRGKNGAAELLGMKPTTLHSRMKKLKINRPEK